MSGYRGIFLDSIHPLIAERLDADTFGFQRHTGDMLVGGGELGDRGRYINGLETYKYLQERTPWMRTVPFAIPQSPEDVTNLAV